MGEVLKLSPPWIEWYRKIDALFGEDPNVLVQYDEEENAINLRVNGQEKADAISKILPTEKTFGNVTLKINVIPSNREPSKIELFQRAFEGNPVFSYALSIDTGMTSNTFNFCVFRNKVVQIWNDNMGDVNGNISTLYENLAREIFDDIDGVLFNTDLEGNPGAPVINN